MRHTTFLLLRVGAAIAHHPNCGYVSSEANVLCTFQGRLCSWGCERRRPDLFERQLVCIAQKAAHPLQS